MSRLLDQPVMMPYKLRPTSEREKRQDGENHTKKDENIIVNVSKLLPLLTDIHRSSCKVPKLSMTIEKRLGLCVFVKLRCAVCKYESPVMPLSETVKEENRPGPPSGVLNSQAILPVMKSKMGVDDLRYVFTCLNIEPPSRSILQKKLNTFSDRMVELGEEQLEENRQFVEEVTRVATGQPFADVSFDVAYSGRPLSGGETAKQSFGGLFEHTTSQKLPLAIAIANKHCRLKNCTHKDDQPRCRRTYPADKTIASSERTLLHRVLRKVRPLPVRSITTDASTQEAKAIRDFYAHEPEKPAHNKCFIHKGRTFEKHVKRLNLKSIPKGNNKTTYKNKLASAIRQRIEAELQNLAKTRQEFDRTKGVSAINNVVPCFAGDHTDCRVLSTVCKAHHETYTPSHLPHGRDLELKQWDLRTIQDCIERHFNAQALESIPKLFNTNSCESMHSTIFAYAPKTTRYTRNFGGLAHSAVHSRTLGTGKATVKIAARVGVDIEKNAVMQKRLDKIDANRRYHAERKATPQYKLRRYNLRRRQANRQEFAAGSLYSADSAASTSAQDHSYGLNF